MAHHHEPSSVTETQGQEAKRNEKDNMIPTDTIEKLEQTWASISALCVTLDETQWKTQTLCPGWTVQDNVSHMIGTERFLHGLPSSAVKAPPRDYVKNAIGASNENEVEERRSKLGNEVLAEWNELVAIRLAALKSGDDTYFAKEMMTPTGPGTLADFLHIRVMDCWVHEQDIRVALDLPGNDESPSAHLSVDRLLRTVPIVVGKRAATPEGETVVLNVTGPVKRSLVVTVTNGRATVVPTRPPYVLAEVSMNSNTFVALACGRIAGADTRRRVDLVGDSTVGLAVVDNFNMMI